MTSGGRSFNKELRGRLRLPKFLSDISSTAHKLKKIKLRRQHVSQELWQSQARVVAPLNRKMPHLHPARQAPWVELS
jgi:hypothetical protein